MGRRPGRGPWTPRGWSEDASLFHPLDVGVEFARESVGGILVGLAVAWVLIRVRKRITDTTTDTALSFMAPWLAYLPAELIGYHDLHGSGVISVVTAGLLLGHKSQVIQTGPSRLSERINWSTIQFLLENAVFLLIGLQIRSLVEQVVHPAPGTAALSLGATVGLGLLATALLILLRFDPAQMTDVAADGSEQLLEGAFVAMPGMIASALETRTGMRLAPGNLSVCADRGLAVFAFGTSDETHEDEDAVIFEDALAQAALGVRPPLRIAG